MSQPGESLQSFEKQVKWIKNWLKEQGLDASHATLCEELASKQKTGESTLLTNQMQSILLENESSTHFITKCTKTITGLHTASILSISFHQKYPYILTG